MRILVADAFEEAGLSGLRDLGCEVLSEPRLEGDSLAARLSETGAEILVVRSTIVGERELKGAAALSLVIRAGAGVNTIDLRAASARAISVSNCPGKNSIAVAELSWGLILALDRRIVDQTVDLREGRWRKSEYGRARGLAGRTLGIVGLGAIGTEVLHRARAFGMRCIGWSRHLDDERAAALEIQRAETIHGLAMEADVVTVHLALAPETRGICDAAFFGAMKPGASFVNTSRGEVVDQVALKSAIAEKGIRAGLDVFALEPAGGAGAFEDDVARLPGVVGTHHVGASTGQAQGAIAAETVRIVRAYMATGQVPNAVNLCERSPATHLLAVRHRDRVGVLARVFGELSRAGINVQQTENVVFEGAEAACARVQVDAAPSEEVLERIRSGEDVLSASLTAL